MQEPLSPALRAAILAALAAFEQEAEPDFRPILRSDADSWRHYGRRAQMNSRFEGWRLLPSLPTGHLGWQRAPWRPLR